MSKLPVSFRVFHRGDPSRVVVYCSDLFERELQALCSIPNQVPQSRLATMKYLLDAFARGEDLPSSKLRKERDGYAFRVSTLRFYGGFSKAQRGSFVLSHPIIKNHEKLAEADLKRIRDCLAAFDRIASTDATNA